MTPAITVDPTSGPVYTDDEYGSSVEDFFDALGRGFDSAAQVVTTGVSTVNQIRQTIGAAPAVPTAQPVSNKPSATVVVVLVGLGLAGLYLLSRK